MLLCELLNPLDFGFGDFLSEDARDTHSIVVDVKHDANGVLFPEVEDQLEHVDDEFSGGVVIIVKQNSVEPGALELLLRFDLRNGPGVVFEPLGHTPS